MLFTCPCCFATISIEAALESNSGRELMGVLASAGPMARPLAAYLGCFRSPTRALAWDRALRLAREVLEIGADQRALAAALAETVEALRAKREQGDARPLKNHNYLKQVLKSVALAAPVQVAGSGSLNEIPARGKRRLAIDVLAEWAENDWLRREIAEGLMALVALSRPGTPGADTIELTAGVWETAMRSAGVTVEQIDQGRVRAGFQPLLKRRLDEWPEPYAVIAELPRRPAQRKLEEPPPSAEERAQSAELLRQARERLERRA
jgi:hypothetical protein